MSSVIIGVIGSLLGVAIGVVAQQIQAARNRRWEKEDSFWNTKRLVYSQFLRSVDSTFIRGMSAQDRHAAFGDIWAAAAEIELIADSQVSKAAHEFAMDVMSMHATIEENPNVIVPGIDRQREQVINRFKADLQI